MYCGNCGVENANTAKFCKECGSSLTPAKIVAPVKAQTPTYEAAPIKPAEPDAEKASVKKEPVKKEPIKIPWKSIGAVIGVLVVVAVVYFIIQANKVINLNDYVKVEYAGTNGYGSAVLSVDYDGIKEKYGDKLKLTKEGKAALLQETGGLIDLVAPVDLLQMCVSASIEKRDDLKNGDRVTYTMKVDSEIENAFNYKLKYAPSEVEVSGLPELQTFDAFGKFTIEYSGIQPNGKAEVKYNGSELSKWDFLLDRKDGLSNGDVITVTISDDVVEACARSSGCVPESLTKTFTVLGLDRRITKLEEIFDYNKEKFAERGMEAFRAYAAKNWSSNSTLEALDHIGNILLVSREQNKYSGNNYLFIVFKAQAHNFYSYGGKTFNEVTPVYWYVRYEDVTANGEDGFIMNDLDYYATPDASFIVDSRISNGWFGTHNWRYSGYPTLEALIDDVITKNSDYYDADSTIDESNAAPIVQSAAETANTAEFILPTSDSVLLTEADLASLNEEQCRLARNEIYARHGRRFNDKELQAYFDSKSWYHGTVTPGSFSESLLSSTEAANLKVIQNYEKKHGYNK